MTTAIIGVGNIGSLLAQHLVSHGEVVVLASKNQSRAQALADELGPLARAASVNDAIAGADPVVFALWVDTIKVAALLPASAHYMKTFGTLGADALAGSANREPRRALLFYATDDVAATTIERLIRAAGFDPLKVGGVADLGRIGARRRPRPVRLERRAPRSRPSAPASRESNPNERHPTSAQPDDAPVPRGGRLRPERAHGTSQLANGKGISHVDHHP